MLSDYTDNDMHVGSTVQEPHEYIDEENQGSCNTDNKDQIGFNQLGVNVFHYIYLYMAKFHHIDTGLKYMTS